MSKVNFFWKVFGGTLAVILITAFVVYLVSLPRIEHSLQREAEERVEQEARWALRVCELVFDVTTETFDTAWFPETSKDKSRARFTLILPEGRVLFDSFSDPAEMDNHSSRAEVMSPGVLFTRFSSTMQQEMTYFALPIQVAGKLRGYSRVSVPVADRETRIADLRVSLLKGALLAGVISLLLTGYFARRVTQPLSEIASLVTEIGAKQTTRRLKVDRLDEIGRLARAVNHMADDLQDQVAHVDRDSAEREAIFAALSAGLLAVDQEQRVLFINPSARTILGMLVVDPRGKPVWELTRNSALIEVIVESLSKRAHVHGETRVGSKNGERTIEITAVPLVGESGVRGGCVLELRDVTSYRRLEAVRRDFVSNVSHELKTPLTAMKGFTEALLEDAEMPTAMRQSFLEKAHKNTERLSAIVSDLLSLSRLESGSHGLDIEVIEAEELTRSVLDDLADLAESHKTELVLECETSGLNVRADAQALKMAISNLVSNAIQYSPEDGKVRVVLTQVGDQVRIDVIDRGIGIPPGEQERVFERFYRVDKARSRKLGGTGLGLAIVRHVMVALGGRVELKSEYGAGCKFTLFLPCV